jgi:hypothetical protein
MLHAQHPLDVATQLEPAGAGRFRGRTIDDYWNMVGQLGGLTNAQLVRAVLEDPRCKDSVVAQTVNFCGAMKQGDSRSSAHWPEAGRRQSIGR